MKKESGKLRGEAVLKKLNNFVNYIKKEKKATCQKPHN